MMIRSRRALVMASRLVSRRTPAPVANVRSIYDDASVTYSGGQAKKGQGGYYGSGGARKLVEVAPHRPELLALEGDVQHVLQVMTQVEVLEKCFEDEEDLNKTLEARGKIKKLMTAPDFMESLDRLECSKGEPIWGLGIEERALITLAREKVNAC